MKVQRKYQNATFWIVSPKLRDLLADYNVRDEEDLRMVRGTYQNWINYGFTWERKKILEELIFTWVTWEICILQWDPFFSCWESISQRPTTFLENTTMNQGRNKPAVSLVQCFFCYCCWVWRQASRKIKDLNDFFFQKRDNFESKRGKLQLGPTGKLSSFSAKGNNASLCNGNRFHQSALEESTAISYTVALTGQAAELYSLTPWKGSSVLTGGIFSPSSSSTGISSYTFHTSARSDPSCHGSDFCSASEMLEQRHTDSSTDRWGWRLTARSWQHSLLTLLMCPCSTAHHQLCCMEATQLTKRLPKVEEKAQVGSVLWNTIKRL